MVPAGGHTKDHEVTEDTQPPKPGSTGSPSPSAALSQSDVRPAAAGHSGSVQNGTPQRMSIGRDGDTISPYINGGIINKRFSYSGSLASESLDLSAHRESLSVSSRVSLSVPGLVLISFPDRDLTSCFRLVYSSCVMSSVITQVWKT